MPTLPWGLTPYGFRAKTLEEIESELATRLRDGIRDSEGRRVLNTEVGAVAQIIGTVASAAREAWEAVEAVHAASDRDRASGASLRSVAAITGTRALGATKSTVSLTLTLGAGVTVPAGSIVSVDGAPEARFVTIESVTSTTARTYSAEAEAETAGPVAANAGTLTIIETPVSGWTGVTNALDAVPGALAETDPELRARAEDELAAPGRSPQDAIRARLLQLLRDKGVTRGSVTVHMNVGDVVDADGLPGHSVEAVVYDGTDNGSAVTSSDIAETLWSCVGAGIYTHGNTPITVRDSAGGAHAVRFTRPLVRAVYIVTAANVSGQRGWDSANGSTLAKNTLVAAADEIHGVGDDVSRFRVLSALFGVAGLIDVTSFTLGFAPAPVGTTNLVIGRREIAAFDTSRVTFTPTVVSPP